MILITCLGEFLSVYILLLILVSVHSLFIYLFILGNPNLLGRIASWLLDVFPVFATGIHVPMGKEL